MRVFLDSNVIFSGLYSPGNAPAIIVGRFVEDEIKVVVSQQVVREAVSAIREVFPEILPKLMNLLTAHPPEIVPAPALEEIRVWTKIIHFEDATILAAAINARPDYFVTGDKHFLNNPQIMTKSGIHIVTPAEFLAILDKR